MNAKITSKTLNTLFIAIIIQISSFQAVSAQSCVTGISDDELYFPTYEDFQYVDVYVNPEWCDTWSAYSNDSWISVDVDYTFQWVLIGVESNEESVDDRVGYVYLDNYTITVHQEGECLVPDQPDSINGSTGRCISTSGWYSISGINGATEYHWSITNGGTINSGQNSTSINASFPNSGTATISVYASNSCGNGTAKNLQVTVNSLPSISIGSNSPVRLEDTLKLTCSGGVSYAWTGPDNFTSSQQNPQISSLSIDKAGTYEVTVTNSSGCSDDASTDVIISDYGGPAGYIGSLVGDNGVVGSIPGSFYQSPSGGAIYYVPVESPEGINGMTPQIGLAYNSQTGNGIAGWGWNISGLSSISRMPKNIYYDGEVENIDFAYSGGPLTLDQQRMIVVQLYTDSIEYRLESDPKVKIMGYERTISGIGWFRIWPGNGTVMEYDQQQVLSSAETYYEQKEYINGSYYQTLSSSTVSVKSILTWYLTKVYDRFGNFIQYDYTQSSNQQIDSSESVMDTFYVNQDLHEIKLFQRTTASVNSDFRLNTVTYGHNENVIYTILMNYENRDDQISSYISGRKVNQTKRLNEINVKYGSETGNLIKKYELNYSQNDQYSYLNSIELTGKNNEKYNKSVFIWEANSYSYTKSGEYSFQSPESTDPTVQAWVNEGYILKEKSYYPADFNGDGISDFFVLFTYCKSLPGSPPSFIYHYCWAVYVNTGEPEYLTYINVQTFWNQSYPLFNLIDSDLDGNDELFLAIDQVNVFNAKCFEYDKNNKFNENTSKDILINIPGQHAHDMLLVSADFEGDGAADHLLLKHSDLTFAGCAGFSNSCSNPNFGASNKYELLDFNGNGKTDIMFRNSSSSVIWEYDENLQTFYDIYSTTSINKDDIVFASDFNGDGNSDILYFDSSGNDWHLLVSDGYQLLMSSVLTPPSLNTSNPKATSYCLSDINQDGKTDIVELLPSSDTLKVFIQKGNSFELKLTQSNVTSDTLRFSAQANADVTAEIFAGMGNPFYYAISQGKAFNVIDTIYNGLGNRLSFTFGNYNYPYKNPDVSTLSPGNESDFFPVQLSNHFFKVVLSSQDDESYTNYEYGHPVIHRNGKGFLGFESTRSITCHGNDSTSVYSYSSLHQKTDSLEYELLPDSVIHKINSTAISKVHSIYSTKYVGSNCYLITDSIINLDKINNNKTVQYFCQYDNFLMPRITFTRFYHNNTQFVALDSTVNDYDNIISGNLRIFGLPDTVKNYKKRPGEITYVRTTVNDYDSNGSLNSSYSERGTEDEIKLEYQYDSFGNVTSITQLATNDPDVPASLRSRTTTMEYSEDGRFLVSKSNPLEQTESYEYIEDIGKIQKINDVNDLETEYIYDGFGRLKKTLLPGNLERLHTLHWSAGSRDAPTGSLYYSFSKATGSEPVITFFDPQNREVRTVSTGYNGQKIYSDKVYDDHGRVSDLSQPYFSGSTAYWTEMKYDNLGRISRKDYPDDRFTSYSYSPRSITTSTGRGSNTQETTITVNVLGETLTVEDNDGNVVETFYYASGLPKQTGITGQSFSTTISYDIYGNRDTISDPDAGQIITNYNVFGELVSQKDALGNEIHYTYDKLGRIDTVKQYKSGSLLQNTKTYVYDNDWIGKLTSITQTGPSSSLVYDYDENLGRLIKTTETFDGKSIINEFTYDDVGRVATRKYPGEVTLTNHYNSYGYLQKITGLDKTIWECTSMNALGQIIQYKQGTVASSASYDEHGELRGQNFRNARLFSYGFDDFGNLTYRKDSIRNLKEAFTYDDLNRLDSVKYYVSNVYQSGKDKITTYDQDGLGNITSMTGTGSDFRYGANGAGPHALTSVHLPEDNFRPPPDSTSYTCFNKISCIADTLEGDSVVKMELFYGTDDQRIKSILSGGSQVQRIKYFFGDYEEITENGSTKKYYYFDSPTGLCGIFVKGSQSDTLWYAYTDHLGSLIYLVNADNSNQYLEYSYDAWGNPREVDDWTEPLAGSLFAQRGFTGHEHMTEFCLINMNGRVYDPALGRFLSPDPFVQDPVNSQSFNRYSYCLNNPLIYTDPDGEFFLTWSFHNGGFSIGFNLTPIGIPLGAGINIGWGNGFSLGGYGEVGYRVGGTGFGSGATISQSFDYNFKNNGWSGTTAEGAYASLGGFNAGANISQTYDFSSNSWSNGWGISVGIGFGNDARGLGFNIGYGSGGFTYGMGGYFNSRAWDSNPDYNQELWNTDCGLLENNNCYSYAIDDPFNNIGGKPQPGAYAGRAIECYPPDMDEIISASLSDGYIKKPNFFNKLGFRKRGYYSVYLVMDNTDGVQDYHWYRQDKGGFWSQKHGSDYVTNIDGSSRLIHNPLRANHFYGGPYYYNNGVFAGNLNYNGNGAFLWVRRR